MMTMVSSLSLAIKLTCGGIIPRSFLTNSLDRHLRIQDPVRSFQQKIQDEKTDGATPTNDRSAPTLNIDAQFITQPSPVLRLKSSADRLPYLKNTFYICINTHKSTHTPFLLRDKKTGSERERKPTLDR